MRSALSRRIAPALAAFAVGGAAIFALLRSDDTHAQGGSSPTLPAAPADTPADTPELPPGHPAIGGMGTGGPHGSQEFAPSDEPAALTWTVPAGWRTMPNPNGLRIATYRVSPDDGDPTEVTVSRAGGSTDANIERWRAQFDDPGPDTRTQRQVGDVGVTMVEVSGIYKGNGMMPADRAVKQDGWTLVAAIATPGSTPYFFKMIGPTARVRSARRAFDTMIGSLTRP